MKNEHPTIEEISSELRREGAVNYHDDFISFDYTNSLYTTNGSSVTATGTLSGIQDKSKKTGLSPIIYFKYVKSKFSTLQKFMLESQIKKLEKAFNKAVENGQDVLAEKFMNLVVSETRKRILYVKGYKFFIDKDVLWKHKRNIQGGHISDTPFKDYTRIIPEDVLEKKKIAEEYFDRFVVLHYWNENSSDVKNMSPDEKAKMKDPILFGICNEFPSKWFFIADWEDEFCTLTFDEVIGVLGEENIGETKNISLE